MEKNTKRNLLTVGAIASIVALGGVATSANAAGQVDSGDIKNQTIRSVDIAADGVGKSEIRTGAVGSLEILDQSIQSRDIDEGAVGRSEIRNGTITTADIADSTEDALVKRATDFAADADADIINEAKRHATEVAGQKADASLDVALDGINSLREDIDALPVPEKGDPGTPGVNGTDGVSGYEVIGQEKRQEPGDVAFPVTCPEGKQAIGGGTKVDDQNKAVALMDGPNGLTENEDGTWAAKAWQGMFRVTERTNVTVYAVCANV